MNIVFTEKQINNLLMFLNRVTITGFAEIEAFNEIMNILINTLQLNKENNI